MRFTALLFTAAALALSACASTESASSGGASGSGDCFRPAQVSGFSVVDDSRVRVRAGTNDYIFTIRGRTRELDWTSAIAVQSTEHLICAGDSTLGVYLVGGEPQLRYAVTDVERVPESGPTGS
jgi:hypothetical protein